MTPSEDQSFTEFLRQKAQESQALGYRPSHFLQMLATEGGYVTVSKLLSKRTPSDGFTKLWELRRLDLTVEALVVESRWRSNFDSQLIANAEKLLSDVGYPYKRYDSDSVVERSSVKTGLTDEVKRSKERLPVETLDRVTPEHVWTAVQMLLDGYSDHQFAASTDYDLLAEGGARLPPKAVFGVAARLALGFEVLPKHFTAGEESACFRILRGSGFSIVKKGEVLPTVTAEFSNEDQDWAEGKARLVTHLLKERAKGLAQAKKSHFKRQHGKLYCERCGLDPLAQYGTVYAESCIEIHHHEVHVRGMAENHRTKLEALQCLCANCHRLVHRLLREQEAEAN